MQEGGRCFFITLQFYHIYCECEKTKVFFIAFDSLVFCVSHARFSSDLFSQCKENVDCFIQINLEYTEKDTDKFLCVPRQDVS